jgi:hypothetical protein
MEFNGYLMEFKNLFDDPNSKRHACAALKRLRQAKGSVLTYSAKFRRLASETGFNDDALMDFFRYGLNDDIKDVLATCFEELTELESFMNFCIKIDQRLYDRKIERGSTRSPVPPNRPRQFSPGTGNNGTVPMDLDSIYTKDEIGFQTFDC